jgi:hypothetical protein
MKEATVDESYLFHGYRDEKRFLMDWNDTCVFSLFKVLTTDLYPTQPTAIFFNFINNSHIPIPDGFPLHSQTIVMTASASTASPVAPGGQLDAKKYDLTDRLAEHLDKHLVLPLLEFLTTKEVIAP